MPRPYGDKFLRFLESPDEENLGVQLGRACVAANIPAAHVAVALEASRMTVYNWFRGGDIRRHRRKEVRAFIDILQCDMDTGRLPARSVADSRDYIDALVGPKPTS